MGAEQSNVSVVVGDKLMLKIYRRLREGAQPEIEVARFLTEVAGFPNTPAYLWAAPSTVPAEGQPTALAVVFAYARNQGDAWGVIVDALERHLEEFSLRSPPDQAAAPAESPTFAYPLDLAATHRPPHCRTAYRLRHSDRRSGLHGRAGQRRRPQTLGRRFARRGGARAALICRAPSAICRMRHGRRSPRSSARAKRCTSALEEMRQLGGSGLKTRTHGDYHLGPGAGGAGRCDDHRLRGRAVARHLRAPRQDIAAPRRGRDAALVRLCHLVGARPAADAGAGRSRRTSRRARSPGGIFRRRTSSTATGRARRAPGCFRRTWRRAAGCSSCSCCRRRCTRWNTRRRTGRHGCRSRSAACST